MDYYNIQQLNNESFIIPTFNIANNRNYMQPYQYADPRLNYPYCTPFPNPGPSQIFCNTLPTPSTHLKQKVNLEIKSDDELWIEMWLSKIGKIQLDLNSTVEIKPITKINNKVLQPNKNFIQIHTAKNSLKNCLRVLNELQKMQEFMKFKAAEMSSVDWKKYTSEIRLMKDEFSKLILQFENPDSIALLYKNIERRRRKRINQKKRKEERRKSLEQLHKIRSDLHRDFDLWLEKMKENVERVKTEEAMKRDADCILAEVTRKKSDARKSLSLITALIKLRQVREHAAIQRGEKVSLEDRSAFAKISEDLIKIWNDAMKTYQTEEKCLQTMLEQNAVEDTKTATADKERKIIDAWHTVLFGPTCIPSPAYWGLTSADKDLETFIAIRRSWDTFLTNDSDKNGSKIPVGWIMPNVYGDKRWTKYLSFAN